MTDFTWRDGERLVRFGVGAVREAPSLLDADYDLLTTARGASAAPDVVAGAARVHEVSPGRVDELSADLLPVVAGDLVVALGGGRVIDVAKAIVAARGHGRAAAIPTTLSAADKKPIQRLPKGAPAGAAPVRPTLVVNDPDLCASQPERELAASAANALGHAIEGPATVQASPVPRLAGREAMRLTASGWDGDTPDRTALALAALLSGVAIDGAGYGLHHVLSQTLARLSGAAHAPANAAMLPHTTAALRRRTPDAIPEGAEELARDLARRAGAERLRDIGVERDALDRCAEAAAQRPQLSGTPPRADVDEIRRLYEAAW